jgi:hypothetical protein
MRLFGVSLRRVHIFTVCVLLFALVCAILPRGVRAADKHAPADLLDDDDSFDDDDFGEEDDELPAAAAAAASKGPSSKQSGAAGASGAYSNSKADDEPAAGKPAAAAGAKGAVADEDESGEDGGGDDDESAYYDAEEFEGVPALPKGSNPNRKAKRVDKADGEGGDGKGKASATRITPVTVLPAAEKPSYALEMAGVAFVVVYAVNFFWGKRQNEQLARQWFEEFRDLFAAQFAELGAYETRGGAVDAPAGGLLKESHSTFKFYASGRRNCQGVLCTLELRKRHDLFGLALALVDLSTTRDTLTVEVQMNEDTMDPFVFAIVRKKEAARLKKANRDLVRTRHTRRRRARRPVS